MFIIELKFLILIDVSPQINSKYPIQFSEIYISF